MTATSTATVVPVAEAERRYWHPVGDGVCAKVISVEDGEAVGLLLLEPDAAVDPHAHDGEHHLYVLEGRCWFGGALLREGSYVHVPAGVRHALHGAGPTGCRVLYVSTGGAA